MSTNNDLCEDVWTQILARLSVKTLLIVRCVCKSWCSIIEDPCFMLIHIKQYHNGNHYDKTKLVSHRFNINENILPKEEDWCSLRNIDTLHVTGPSLLSNRKIHSFLSGSCFGLVLLLDIINGSPRIWPRLWNPYLRKSLYLPARCPFVITDTNDVVYTLGFSSLTHCFKVCAFQLDTSEETMPVAIITVSEEWNNNQWRTITRESGSANIPVKGPKVDSDKGFLFFQEAAHCIAGDTHLLSFNFVTETFSWVELPDASEKTILSAKYVFLFDEALAIMSLSEVNRRIWVMNKDDSGVVSWKLWFSCASSETDFSKVSESIEIDSKVFYLNDDSCRTRFTSSNCSYDIATSKVEELIDLDDEGDCFILYNYIESLALCKQLHSEFCNLLDVLISIM